MSPQLLEQPDGLDAASCAYRQSSELRPLCYALSEQQQHHSDSHRHVHVHAQGSSCEHGRCEAGRYFLGAPPPSRDTWWGSSRSIVPLSRSSVENQDGFDIGAVHSYGGEKYRTDTFYICT